MDKDPKKDHKEKNKKMSHAYGWWVLVCLVSIIGAMGIARSYVIFQSRGAIIMLEEIGSVEECSTALVLGAGVRSDGTMSGILRERAVTAEQLYRQKVVCTIIISGIVSTDEGGIVYDEVTPVRDHLITAGVVSDDISVDSNGFDTFQSMSNARDVYNVDHMIIITQDFHQARAVYIARALGIDAHGYVAQGYPYAHRGERMFYRLREWPAAVKAIVEVVTER